MCLGHEPENLRYIWIRITHIGIQCRLARAGKQRRQREKQGREARM